MDNLPARATRGTDKRASHLRPLCVAICALFACDAAHAAASTTRYVTSCADDGSTGTLRNQITAALDNDIVDVHSQLPTSCSTITLTQGAIHGAGPRGVAVVGPNDRTVSIAGNGSDRLFVWPQGALEFQYLTLRGGRSNQLITGQGVYGGGCIYARGLVTLQHATVTDCAVNAVAANARAYGGAIYDTYLGLRLVDSQITNSVVTSAGSRAVGGGVAVVGTLSCARSTISHNALRGPANHRGGGADVFGAFTLDSCTVDSNEGGGINGYGYSGYGCDPNHGCYPMFAMRNCTISGNIGGAGVVERGGTLGLLIDNSTIVGNSGSGAYDAGVYGKHSVTARSSIFANNPGLDIYLPRSQLYGADNLVMSTNLTNSQDAIPPASGVIVSTSNPRLAPLGYHGGTTRTHALLAGSPALNAGNNNAMLTTDQRGAARESPSGQADIGAYERQPKDDEVFYDGLEGYP